MPLAFETRHVGDVGVVRCRGRIVEGSESAALERHVAELLPYEPYVLLHLAGVDFIDSSGLGLLVRLLARTRNANGNLKLCAISAKLDHVLGVTNLKPIFETYASEEEAIAAFYQRTDSPDAVVLKTSILCLEPSPDVLAYVRELLRQAGYAPVTTTNVADALTLLKATRPTIVIVGNGIHVASDTGAADSFKRLLAGISVVELPAHFSTDDAGAAGRQLLDRVRAILPRGVAE